MKTRRDMIDRIEGSSGIYDKWEEFSDSQLYSILYAFIFSVYSYGLEKFVEDIIKDYVHLR